MRSILRLAILASTLAFTLSAQTTGVFCCNDYTINGVGSGTTSCTKYFNPAGSPLSFDLCASTPFMPVLFAYSFCPCVPGGVVLPSCCAPVNSLDLTLACPIFTFAGTTVPHPACCGLASLTFPFCPAGLNFSTQAVVFDPTCPVGFQFSQAYDVCCL